jgi:hypothetical protein
MQAVENEQVLFCPHKLIGLWEMIELSVRALCRLLDDLEAWGAHCVEWMATAERGRLGLLTSIETEQLTDLLIQFDQICAILDAKDVVNRSNELRLRLCGLRGADLPPFTGPIGLRVRER